MLKQALATAGFDILGVAAAGAEAIAIARETTPDLILMDIRLSDDVDGISAAMEIDHETSIIFMTAFVDSATISRAEQTKPIAILEKPLNMKQLISLIHTARK
jgi:AmiR/NasT family two-component response regulator